MVSLPRPFISIFENLPDSRRPQGRRYSLQAVLTIVILALIGQQNSLRQIAAWAQGLDLKARRRLGLRYNRVPSEATIRRVLHNLDVEALVQALQDWVEEVLAAFYPTTEKRGLAIDAKTLRGSHDDDEGLPALRVLNALIHELGVFIRSQAIPAETNDRRQHRHVENKGHRVLDVVFGEDRSRLRKARGPEALAVLRRAVITLLRLFASDDITATRSAMAANVRQAMSPVGPPLDFR